MTRTVRIRNPSPPNTPPAIGPASDFDEGAEVSLAASGVTVLAVPVPLVVVGEAPDKVAEPPVNGELEVDC